MRTLLPILFALLVACSGTDGSDGPDTDYDPPSPGSDQFRWCDTNFNGDIKRCTTDQEKAAEPWEERPYPSAQWKCKHCKCELVRVYSWEKRDDVHEPKLGDCDKVEVQQ